MRSGVFSPWDLGCPTCVHSRLCLRTSGGDSESRFCRWESSSLPRLIRTFVWSSEIRSNNHLASDHGLSCGARGRTRTCTPRRAADFKSATSATFVTRATIKYRINRGDSRRPTAGQLHQDACRLPIAYCCFGSGRPAKGEHSTRQICSQGQGDPIQGVVLRNNDLLRSSQTHGFLSHHGARQKHPCPGRIEAGNGGGLRLRQQ